MLCTNTCQDGNESVTNFTVVAKGIEPGIWKILDLFAFLSGDWTAILKEYLTGFFVDCLLTVHCCFSQNLVKLYLSEYTTQRLVQVIIIS